MELFVGKLRAASDLFTAYVHQIPRLGFVAATLVFVAEASERRPLSLFVRPLAPARFKIKPAGYRSPLTIRRADTDRAVIRQVLDVEEYRPMANLANVNVVVDCGANIGVSAYYFLHRYPNARVIAVEPDSENFALCRRNLAPFGERATVLHAAVWSECRPLRITPASRAEGSWGRRVEPAASDASNVEGLTIPEILKRANVTPPIDLLKVDIEGAESEVFRDHPAWLETTRHIAIELHGLAARSVFLDALADYEHTRYEAGELTIVRNLSRHDTPPAPLPSPALLPDQGCQFFQ